MKTWIVDAFASALFKGNPACVLEPFGEWPKDSWLQSVASEYHQSEVAFLKYTNVPSRYDIRWFTPTTEVPMCGHATLAAAHVLFCEYAAAAEDETITFSSLSGELYARKCSRGYELNFPLDQPQQIDAPDGLSTALGTAPLEVWASRQYLCALLEDEHKVRSYKPRFQELAAVANDQGYEKGSLIIAAQSDSNKDYDAVSRFFAPLFGIPEDPVTGSAHCMLAPLFGKKLSKQHLHFLQAYPGRGGDVFCTIQNERVLLSGAAITF